MYLEYINNGFIVLSTIMILMLFLVLVLVSGKSKAEGKKPKGLLWISLGLAVSIIIPLSDGYTTKQTIDKNIEMFHSNKELRCAIGFNTYRVGKRRGWELMKESFSKNDLLVDAQYCEKNK